jgi:GLPGLI family protein
MWVMKKISVLLVLLCSAIYYGQTKRFVYNYKFVPDSTQTQNTISEIMFLDIHQGMSEFYGYEKFRSDSLMAEELQRGLVSPPPMKEFISYRIVKKNHDIESFNPLLSNLYRVKDTRPIHWKLHPEYVTILNYKAQKATAEFAGRNWEAWFIPDITIQDGPYKFRGLPGLILRIKDRTNSHSFELTAIQNLPKNPEYPFVKNFARQFDVDWKQYYKIFRNYRKALLQILSVKSRITRMPRETWSADSKK